MMTWQLLEMVFAKESAAMPDPTTITFLIDDTIAPPVIYTCLDTYHYTTLK